MAYGVISSSVLLSFGIPPATTSASVHASELFTTAASGLAHLRFGNVDRQLFIKLLIPGIAGGVVGAYVLTSVSGDAMKPFVAIYLLLMGVRILWKGIKQNHGLRVEGKLAPLGLAGGFFDAIGGGGWGPIVTSTLMARGNHPRFAIGSVNLAEFFVTAAQSVVFILAIGSSLLGKWQVIVGLIIGGVIAAPIAAMVAKKLPARVLMVLVGILIIALSIRTFHFSL